MSQADGVGKQKAPTIHQLCGNHLSLRDLRVPDQADGERALDANSLSPIRPLRQYKAHGRKRIQISHCAGVVPSRSITARRVVGCSHLSRFGLADWARWYRTASLRSTMPQTSGSVI